MNKALDRALKLVALANSTHSEEEARTAAREACRLIGLHSLLSAVQPQPQRQRPTPKPQEQWNGPIDSPVSRGDCWYCHGPINARQRVVWQPGKVAHLRCYHRAYGY